MGRLSISAAGIAQKADDAFVRCFLQKPLDAAGLTVGVASDQRPFRNFGWAPLIARGTQVDNEQLIVIAGHDRTSIWAGPGENEK
jgi:hypothetical protein